MTAYQRHNAAAARARHRALEAWYHHLGVALAPAYLLAVAGYAGTEHFTPPWMGVVVMWLGVVASLVLGAAGVVTQRQAARLAEVDSAGYEMAAQLTAGSRAAAALMRWWREQDRSEGEGLRLCRRDLVALKQAAGREARTEATAGTDRDFNHRREHAHG